MGVDARHDHSMRIPRPDRTVMIGVPNACTMCHNNKPAVWARDAIKNWYPSPKPGAQDFAEAFDLADRNAPGGEAALLKVASSLTSSHIARASALTRLGQLPSRDALELAAKSLKIDDPLVRTAAISIIAGADPVTRSGYLGSLLQDPSRLVRMDAARALAGAPEENLTIELRVAFDKALAEYIAGQLHTAERPESQSNLAALYRDRGKLDEARVAFRKAIDVDPTFVAASISLAELERTDGNERGAEDILRAARSANPESGHVQHALGLSLIRQKRMTEALPLLADAVLNAPDEPRFGYVLAIALHDFGKAAEARDVLKNTLARHPYNRDVLAALTSYEVEAAKYSSALEFAERLLELEPENPEFTTLVGRLKQQVR
jgi:Flp pilus assembly protein TadD